MKIIGGIIVAVGIFLFLGNILGFFPTFPLAGWITIMIGGAIAKSGR